MTPPPINRLMTGEYAKALAAFDRSRTELYRAFRVADGRRLVAAVERSLLDARLALWAEEKRAKSSPANVTIGASHFPALFVVSWPAISDPRMSGDYGLGLDALHRGRTDLDAIDDPRAARRVIDRMLHDILTVRRALWLSRTSGPNRSEPSGGD